MSEPDYEFAAQVLETPLGPRGYREAVEAERKKIQRRYTQLKHDNIDWTFSVCATTARAEWLKGWLTPILERLGDLEAETELRKYQ